MSQGLVLTNVEHLYSFLAARARWVVSHHFEKASVQREKAVEQLPEDTMVGNGPECALADCAQVAQMLASLPEGHRRAVQLYVLDGLTRQEIAECTGWAMVTVYRRIREGLGMLRDAAGVGRTTHSDKVAARDAEARDVFLASVAADKPLTAGVLGTQFAMSRSWAINVINATGYKPPTTRRAHLISQIARDIESGTVPSGAPLPRVCELARRFGVEPSAVCCALDGLLSKNLVNHRDGRWYACPDTHTSTPQLREAVTA
jgi:hypothetical protein